MEGGFAQVSAQGQGNGLFCSENEAVGDAAVLAADSGQNDKRFYTLMELVEMEPIFERKF